MQHSFLITKYACWLSPWLRLLKFLNDDIVSINHLFWLSLRSVAGKLRYCHRTTVASRIFHCEWFLMHVITLQHNLCSAIKQPSSLADVYSSEENSLSYFPFMLTLTLLCAWTSEKGRLWFSLAAIYCASVWEKPFSSYEDRSCVQIHRAESLLGKVKSLGYKYIRKRDDSLSHPNENPRLPFGVLYRESRLTLFSDHSI